MIKIRLLFWVLLSIFNYTAVMAMSVSDIMNMVPPDNKVMPCVRKIPITQITRAVIPIEPFRGVNFIFPFKLENANTLYSLSSDKLWDYNRANGLNIFNVFYKSFNSSDWGKVNDLSIAVNDYNFSLTLKAEPGRHCSNIVFTLSEEEKKKLVDGETKEYLTALDIEYELKVRSLDVEAERRALKIVGALVSANVNTTRIHEEKTIELPNGDEIIVYVDEILGYGKFSVLKIEIENESNVNPLYIKTVEVFTLSDNKKRERVEGATGFDKKMSVNSAQYTNFTTREGLPETGAVLVVTTDLGELEVTW